MQCVNNMDSPNSFFEKSNTSSLPLAILLFSTQIFIFKGNLNILRKDGMSPLYDACFHNHKSVVKWLLERNANPSTIITEDGTAPLHIASHQGYLYIVKLLLRKKSRPKCSKEKWRNTPDGGSTNNIQYDQ